MPPAALKLRSGELLEAIKPLVIGLGQFSVSILKEPPFTNAEFEDLGNRLIQARDQVEVVINATAPDMVDEELLDAARLMVQDAELAINNIFGGWSPVAFALMIGEDLVQRVKPALDRYKE